METRQSAGEPELRGVGDTHQPQFRADEGGDEQALADLAAGDEIVADAAGEAIGVIARAENQRQVDHHNRPVPYGEVHGRQRWCHDGVHVMRMHCG